MKPRNQVSSTFWEMEEEQGRRKMMICLILVECQNGVAAGYGLDERGSRVLLPLGALGPTQTPIQWVPEALSLG